MTLLDLVLAMWLDSQSAHAWGCSSATEWGHELVILWAIASGHEWATLLDCASGTMSVHGLESLLDHAWVIVSATLSAAVLGNALVTALVNESG